MAPTVRPSPVAGSWYPGDGRRACAAEVDRYLAAVPAPRAARPPRRAHRAARRPALFGPGGRPRLRPAARAAGGRRSCWSGPRTAWRSRVRRLRGRARSRRRSGRARSTRTLADALLAADPRPPRGPAAAPRRALARDAAAVPAAPAAATRGSCRADGRPVARRGVDALAAALARALAGRDALLVASSDLCHYHPRPRRTRPTRTSSPTSRTSRPSA